MTCDTYNQKLDQFKAELGHGMVSYHLHKLTEAYVQLTRWRKYYFNSLTPRQIKHIGNVVNKRHTAQRIRDERKCTADDNARAARGAAITKALETIVT